jgi:tetratricopeptide (TPR) repeat protein
MDTVALLHVCLASALQERGKIDEAKNILCIALQTGRPAHTTPLIGNILVALGQLRIDQAVGISDVCDSQRIRSLVRARNTLQRALEMESLEAETRIEGQLALAQVMFLEGAIEIACQQVLQTLEMAQQLDLMWLVGHAECLLGSIFATFSQDEQADQYFAQARDKFHTYGMRLAYGRTLLLYGQFLQQKNTQKEAAHQQGQVYLHEAREIFRECYAAWDLQRLEQVLANTSDSSTTHKKAMNVLSEFSPVS